MKTKRQLERITLEAVRPVPKVSVSSWADEYRQLPSDSAEPGKWKTSRVPYMREPMDAFAQSEVKRVVIKSAAQVGKTEVILNIIGRYAHLDPCTIMMIQPTLDMAQDISKTRVTKMIEDTKVLTPRFYGLKGTAKSRDANQTILNKFFTGGRLVFVGANSPAGLASRPIRILLCDEVDRFPLTAGGSTKGEGDPVELAAKRTTTYWDAKIGLFSTPTTEGASRIDTEYLLGTQEEWQHQCPNCGEYHALDYRQMITDHTQKKDSAGNRVIVVNEVKWRCPDCGFEFGEQEIKSSPQKYVAQNPDALKNGIRSFWLNGFSSPWLTWTGIMREWLEAKGDAARENVIYNTRFGLSYKLRGYYDDENVFLARREDYGAEIPTGVLLLTAAVDVQGNRLEYEVVGWGEGLERWGITKGVVMGAPNQPETWQGLDLVLSRTFYYADGTGIQIARTFVDSGYNTKTVYEYCHERMNRGIFPIKGQAGMGVPLLYKFFQPKSINVLLTILGVNNGKQEVMSNLGITEVGKCYMHYPNEDEYLSRGYDEIYFKGLISEHKVVRKSGGVIYEAWEPISEGVRNEPLDLAVYNLACVYSCIGNDAESFWSRRREIRNVGAVKEKKPAKKVQAFKKVEIW